MTSLDLEYVGSPFVVEMLADGFEVHHVDRLPHGFLFRPNHSTGRGVLRGHGLEAAPFSWKDGSCETVLPVGLMEGSVQGCVAISDEEAADLIVESCVSSHVEVDSSGCFSFPAPMNQPCPLRVRDRGRNTISGTVVVLPGGDTTADLDAPVQKECSLGIRSRYDDGNVVVDEVVEGTPAHESGLRTGVALITLDGLDVLALGVPGFQMWERGLGGTTATIRVEAEGVTSVLDLVRSCEQP